MMELDRSGSKSGSNFRCDTTTRIEVAGNSHAARLAGGDKVVENCVDRVFVKNATIPEAEQIILQAFEFDYLLVWHVVYHDGCKVWLASFWANGSKFGAGVLNFVITVRKLVGESFQLQHRVSQISK